MEVQEMMKNELSRVSVKLFLGVAVGVGVWAKYQLIRNENAKKYKDLQCESHKLT